MAGGLLRSTKALIEQLPAFGGGREGIALPFQFIFGGEDNLKLFVSNTVFGQVIRLTGRWIESGSDEVQVFSQDFAHSGTPTEQTFRFNVGRGVLLNVAVLPAFNICQRGQCFVRVDIERGENARLVLGTLLQGYIDSSGGRAWPGSPLESAVEGPGMIRTVQSAAPAAGAASPVLMAAATRWRVLSVECTLVCNPVVMTRNIFCRWVQNSILVGFTISSLRQVAASSGTHIFAAGVGAAEGSGSALGQGALPVPLILQTGGGADGIIQVEVFPMDPGDQLSQANVLVEEWRNPITTP